MGQKLEKLYAFVEQNGGLQARMRLAMMTGISSQKAAEAEDSADNVAKFQAAIKEVTGKDAPAV